MNIGTLTTIMAGHPLRGRIEHAPKGDVRLIRMKDVDPETGIDGSQLYRVVLTGRKKPDFLRRGDILFVGRGYRIFAVMVDRDLPDTVAGPHFFIIRVKKSRTDLRPDYLCWYLNHTQAQRYFFRHVAGTALPHINRGTLEQLPVIVPPVAVQAQIVKAHECRLREKALLETLIAKKKQFLDAILDKTLEPYQ